MGQLSRKLRSVEGGGIAFWCPGCGETHVISVDGSRGNWGWDRNVEAPTFSPSIKVTYRHPKGHSNENPAPEGYAGEYVEDVCHSFIRAGRIKFLSDCTHGLRGRTVDLPDLPVGLAD
jgi:hypothetical protein